MPNSRPEGFLALEPTAEDVVAACAKSGREIGLDEAQTVLEGLDRDELNGVILRAIEHSDDLDRQAGYLVDGIAAMLADGAPSPAGR